MADKALDLAGPGIGSYEEVDKILPSDYASLLDRKRTQKAIYDVKEYIEKGLAEELNLMFVQVPLIVEVASGMNDMLDRDGSRTPVEFQCGLGLDEPIRASIVQAATKWKRWALEQFDCEVGEGINTDMRAVRKDYFLDHDHSSYVDQWDWEQVITADDRNLEYLKTVVNKIWKVITGAENMVMDKYPELQDPRFPPLPDNLHFIHAEEILAEYPDLPRKQRETEIIKEYGAVFIIGIGWVLDDGYPHEMRAADYDDWVTPTIVKDGKLMHGLNGDILVYNHVTKRRHELSSMGIRVTRETLKQQMKIAEREDELSQPYHQMILNDEIPLSIGGGIGQSRVQMLLLRKAHLGEVSTTVWPKQLHEVCEKHNIFVLK
ncbi:MAG: aspartate--ammonia ligase [Gammaproteobacteria bacterium]|nr:aspartate--ammonia ligase [Gammaproteobacteria bacterium]MDH3407999.1 aspartate--ammonia ligase [Gammaproteobacteria bacterium]